MRATEPVSTQFGDVSFFTAVSIDNVKTKFISLKLLQTSSVPSPNDSTAVCGTGSIPLV